MAIGCIDQATGELFVATDSRAVSKDRKTIRDGVTKAVRLTDECAIAFSGTGMYCNVLVANLFGWVEAAKEGREDVLERINAERPPLDMEPFEIATFISRLLRQYAQECVARHEKPEEINAVLVGRHGEWCCMAQWRYEQHWANTYSETTSLATVRDPVIFGPYDRQEVEDTMKDAERPLWQRVHDVVAMNHEYCPWGVNMDVSVLRFHGFEPKKLSALLSNSPTQDPSASASHADAGT